MRYNKETEAKLKLKGIEWWSDDYYYSFKGYNKLSKAELASALRDIFKIGLVPTTLEKEWYACKHHHNKICEAIDTDADEATLKVVEKITEAK